MMKYSSSVSCWRRIMKSFYHAIFTLLFIILSTTIAASSSSSAFITTTPTPSATTAFRKRRQEQTQPRLLPVSSLTMTNGDDTIATATETSEPTTTTSETTTTTNSFVSPTMRVYIEDTDAYGIMYNGNYLKAYDRALYTNKMMTMTKDSNTNGDTVHNNSIHNNNWSIVSFDRQKFVSSPRLGEDYVIRGSSSVAIDTTTTTTTILADEIWDLEMTNPNGDVVYNSISGLRISYHDNNNNNNNNNNNRQGEEDESSSIPSAPPPPPYTMSDFVSSSSSSKTKKKAVSVEQFESRSTVYRDEIDAHRPNHLPLRICLNIFERSRSDMLGGPDMLRKLQEEDGIVVVVTGIRSCTTITSVMGVEEYNNNDDDDDDDDDEGITPPGTPLTTHTIAVGKRKGTIIECYQTITKTTTRTTMAQKEEKDSSLSSSSSRRRVAQGQINLMLLDAKTRRPTRNVPDSIFQRILKAQQ